MFPSLGLCYSPTSDFFDVKSARAATMTQAETRGTVLVIDDEETVVDIARRTLERHGYSVLTASDGHEATMVFRDNAERINAVLLDMSMPRMSGADVFVQIRGIRPAVPII